MSQSLSLSVIEALTNVVAGFVMGVGIQAIAYPVFGFVANLGQQAALSAIFTLASLARSFLIRRLFDRLGGHGDG